MKQTFYKKSVRVLLMDTFRTIVNKQFQESFGRTFMENIKGVKKLIVFVGMTGLEMYIGPQALFEDI